MSERAAMSWARFYARIDIEILTSGESCLYGKAILYESCLDGKSTVCIDVDEVMVAWRAFSVALWL